MLQTHSESTWLNSTMQASKCRRIVIVRSRGRSNSCFDNCNKFCYTVHQIASIKMFTPLIFQECWQSRVGTCPVSRLHQLVYINVTCNSTHFPLYNMHVDSMCQLVNMVRHVFWTNIGSNIIHWYWLYQLISKLHGSLRCTCNYRWHLKYTKW